MCRSWFLGCCVIPHARMYYLFELKTPCISVLLLRHSCLSLSFKCFRSQPLPVLYCLIIHVSASALSVSGHSRYLCWRNKTDKVSVWRRVTGICAQSRPKSDPRLVYGISDVASGAIGPETFCTTCEVWTVFAPYSWFSVSEMSLAHYWRTRHVILYCIVLYRDF